MTSHHSSNKADLIREITELSSEWFDTTDLIANIEATTQRVNDDTIQPLIEYLSNLRDVAEILRDDSFSRFCIEMVTREMSVDPADSRFALTFVTHGEVSSIRTMTLIIASMHRALDRLGHEQTAEVIQKYAYKMNDIGLLDQYAIRISYGRKLDALSDMFDRCLSSEELVTVMNFFIWVTERFTEPEMMPVLSDHSIATLRRYCGIPFEWIPLDGMAY